MKTSNEFYSFDPMKVSMAMYISSKFRFCIDTGFINSFFHIQIHLLVYTLWCQVLLFEDHYTSCNREVIAKLNFKKTLAAMRKEKSKWTRYLKWNGSNEKARPCIYWQRYNWQNMGKGYIWSVVGKREVREVREFWWLQGNNPEWCRKCN